jgi:NAD(P)-dependent dehydrogenase (short-subunit alcohol dehydrogenase family)
VRPAQVDVGDEASVRRLFAAVHQASGRLDVLVACAGAGVFKPAVDISAAEWDEVLRTNLTGAFFCARESLRLMAAQGGGRIVFIGSIAGVMPLSGNAAYGASKYGLHGLAQILNEEGKASGVRVSIVHPGAVRSEMTAGRFAASDLLDASDVAETVLDIVRRPAHVRIDEVRIFPPKGVL